MGTICPKCHSSHTIKNGHVNHKQNHLCCNCHRQFLDNRAKPEISEETKNRVRALLCERLSLRAICRLTHVSLTWLRYFLQKEAEKAAHQLQAHPIAQSDTAACLSLQIDELWTFVKKKAHPIWIWLVLHAQTREILAYAIGPRTKETFLTLWSKIPHEIKKKLLSTPIALESMMRSFQVNSIDLRELSLKEIRLTSSDLIAL